MFYIDEYERRVDESLTKRIISVNGFPVGAIVGSRLHDGLEHHDRE